MLCCFHWNIRSLNGENKRKREGLINKMYSVIQKKGFSFRNIVLESMFSVQEVI